MSRTISVNDLVVRGLICELVGVIRDLDIRLENEEYF